MSLVQVKTMEKRETKQEEWIKILNKLNEEKESKKTPPKDTHATEEICT